MQQLNHNLNYLKTSFENLDNNWQNILNNYEINQQLHKIDQTLNNISQTQTVFPPAHLTFNALQLTPFEQIKVVIIGQDPYHGDNQATGLSFWVEPHITTPSSLRNIYKEIALEYQIPKASSSLENWAKNGVLLLNSSLSVIKNQANSLAHIGWDIITDHLIAEISKQRNNVVFMLWGNFAKEKAKLIDAHKHLILQASHPSFFSANRGFFGCNHFIMANQYLQQNNLQPIDWLN